MTQTLKEEIAYLEGLILLPRKYRRIKDIEDQFWAVKDLVKKMALEKKGFWERMKERWGR